MGVKLGGIQLSSHRSLIEDHQDLNAPSELEASPKEGLNSPKPNWARVSAVRGLGYLIFPPRAIADEYEIQFISFWHVTSQNNSSRLILKCAGYDILTHTKTRLTR